ncbi:MAG: hypothetical protein ACO3NK_12620 [Prochlorotrichaceae cyanobacterium]|jgi:hypothetical protein
MKERSLNLSKYIMQTSPVSLQNQIWQKLQRLPLPQQQILLTFLDFLLSQSQLESPTPSDLSVTCGAWQDDPRNADDIVDDIYTARSISHREYSL